MPSPKWSEERPPMIAAAIAAAALESWAGPPEGASNRFTTALRRILREEFEEHELLGLQVFHRQMRPPEGYEAPPASSHMAMCPRCQTIRSTPHHAPFRGRVKLQALRDEQWLRTQFAKGLNFRQVAEKLGCDLGAVAYWARKHGIDSPQVADVKQLDADVARLHRAKEAPGAIAKAVGTTVQNVRASLKRQGLATKKTGHWYFAEEWWRSRLEGGMTKADAAREAGITQHAATNYVHRFGLGHITKANRKPKAYPELLDPGYLRPLLRRHEDNYASAAREVGCSASYVSRCAREVLGRDPKHENHPPHSEPSWWRDRLDRGMTTWEMAEDAGIEVTTALERLRILGWIAEAYRNNTARERKERTA